jgi:hypothetical protein
MGHSFYINASVETKELDDKAILEVHDFLIGLGFDVTVGIASKHCKHCIRCEESGLTERCSEGFEIKHGPNNCHKYVTGLDKSKVENTIKNIFSE